MVRKISTNLIYMGGIRKVFSRIDGLQPYEKVYSAWNTHELSVIAKWNVQLLELRSFLGGPVVLINREKVPDTAIASYKNSLDEVRKTTLDFQLRFIFTRMKQTGDSGLIHSMQEALRLRKQYPRCWLLDLISIGEDHCRIWKSLRYLHFFKLKRKRDVPVFLYPIIFTWWKQSDKQHKHCDAVILKSQPGLDMDWLLKTSIPEMDGPVEEKIAIEVLSCQQSGVGV